MRYWIIFFCLVFTEIFIAGHLKLSVFDELEPIYDDMYIIKEDTVIELDCPKNSIAAFHIVLKNLSNNNIIQIQEETSGLSMDFNLFRLLHVPVEENTGLDSRTEQWDKKRNPYVIRRAPFRIYDVLSPVQVPFLSSNDTEVFRLQWQIKEETEAAEYIKKIKIRTLGEVRTIQVVIRVYDVSVPVLSEKSYGYTNWFSINNIAKVHSLEPWSDDFFNMLKKYADLMAYGRQNMFFVPLKNLVEIVNHKPVLDTVRMNRYIQVFKDAGLRRVEFTHFAFRTANDWSSTTLSSVFDENMLVNSEEGQDFYRLLFEQIKQAVREFDLEGQCCFHIADEPTNEVAVDYKKFVQLFREYFPNEKILEATMTEELTGSVDIWTPQLQEYQQNQDFYNQLKKDGAEIWVYSCLIPGGKWLNRLLDQEKLRQVYIGWSLPYFHLDGFLHWGLNQYHVENPFEQSVVDHPQAPNTNNQLPAGDTHVIYPGPDGPLSSLRFEAHRIGMEDAELLRILKQKKKKEFNKIAGTVFRSFSDYSVSPQNYRKAKQNLLRSL